MTPAVADAVGSAKAASADAPATPVVPVCDSAQMCTFSWGSRVFAVDGQNGARIVTFALAGDNVLVAKTAGAAEFGATFWPSPQTLWNWPPIAAVDSGPYTVALQGNMLIMTSGTFTLATGEPMMTVEKHFAVDAASSVVTITYVLVNQGNSSISLAPWEVTRVAPGGVAFFPDPAGGAAPLACSGTFSAPATSDLESYTFFADLPGTGETKLCAAGGAKGYQAYLGGSLLLVQAWPAVPVAEIAAGEGEDELYSDPSFTYVEVENQGPYLPIAGGGRAEWTVHWTLTSVAAVTGGADASAVLASSSLRQAIEQVADGAAALP
jgi:hypothetical protein